MNLKTNQKGFTIVELLIVIVVIAILAAISIVAFTGIQDRARTSSGQSLANQVEKKAQAFYTVNNDYPASHGGFASVPEAELEGIASGNLVIATDPITDSAPAKSAYGSGENVSYRRCSANGAQVGYWDYSEDEVVVRTVGTC